MESKVSLEQIDQIKKLQQTNPTLIKDYLESRNIELLQDVTTKEFEALTRLVRKIQLWKSFGDK